MNYLRCSETLECKAKYQPGRSSTTEPRRKRANNEEDLQDELDKLRIELSNSKSQQKFLENQLLKEKKDGGLYKPIVERKG